MKIVSLLITSVLIIVSCSGGKIENVNHLDKAIEHYRNDDLNKALAEIDTAIILDSTNYDAIILKAKINEGLGFYSKAIETLRPLQDKAYKNDTIYYLLGSNSFSMAHHYNTRSKNESLYESYLKDAIDFLSMAISKNPEYYKAYILKSSAEHNYENYTEALITIKNAINLFPDSISLILSRGIEKRQLGDWTDGLKDLNTAISSDRLDSVDMATAYRFRAFIMENNMDDANRAIEDLLLAISYNPKNEFLYYNLADLYRSIGEKSKACANYRKAADLGIEVAYEIIGEYCNK